MQAVEGYRDAVHLRDWTFRGGASDHKTMPGRVTACRRFTYRFLERAFHRDR